MDIDNELLFIFKGELIRDRDIKSNSELKHLAKKYIIHFYNKKGYAPR